VDRVGVWSSFSTLEVTGGRHVRVEAPDPRPGAAGGGRRVRRDDEQLADIVEAAQKIAVRTARGRAAFDADEDTQIVLLHLIRVIGEVAAGLSDGFIAQHPEVPWRQIIATRNRVVHGYFEVDLDILWDAAIINVPDLASQVQRIQFSLGDDIPEA
jgi:uncharacterized protein with HEPN domain